MKKHLSTILLILVFLAGLSLLLYPSFANWWNTGRAISAITTYNTVAAAAEPSRLELILAEAEQYNRELAQKGNSFNIPTEEQLEKYNQMEDTHAGQTADAALMELDRILVEAQQQPPEEAPGPEGEEASEETVPVGEVEYLGILQLPTLGMSLPIAANWDYDVLKSAPCRYSGSVDENDLVLCGHNYRRHFGPLDRLKPGDLLYFTQMNGMTTTYRVLAAEVLQPTDVEAMVISDCALTLFTCTYSGQARYTVRCIPED